MFADPLIMRLTDAASAWMLTYLVHSTILILGVWAVTSLRSVRDTSRDVLWKLALVGGFVTASVQTVAAHEPLAGQVSLNARAHGAEPLRITVRENIDLFAGLYGVTGPRLEQRRAWILEMAGLEGAESRDTQDLPLGWKQRLALGCALVHEPQILFLDEPTSGVDPVARRRFWGLIADLAAAGTTVFVSTHYMEEAEFCHRLALMNRGRLIALEKQLDNNNDRPDNAPQAAQDKKNP